MEKQMALCCALEKSPDWGTFQIKYTGNRSGADGDASQNPPGPHTGGGDATGYCDLLEPILIDHLVKSEADAPWETQGSSY